MPKVGGMTMRGVLNNLQVQHAPHSPSIYQQILITQFVIPYGNKKRVGGLMATHPDFFYLFSQDFEKT